MVIANTVINGLTLIVTCMAFLVLCAICDDVDKK